MAKKYLSKMTIGGVAYDLKDAEARQSIADIQVTIAGGVTYIGISETALTDESTTSPVTTDKGTYATSPTGDQKQLNEGMMAIYNKKEFIWSNGKWREFGDQSNLGALAYKSSASGSYKPAGTNAASSVTLTGGGTSKLVTTSITGTNGTETVSKVTKTSKKLATTSIKGVAGTESVSAVSKTSKKLTTTSITGTNGTESVSKVTKSASKLVTTSLKGVSGTATVHDTPTLNKSAIGSASGWNAGTMFSASVDESTETVTFSAGTAPSLTVTSTQVGTSLTAGTEKTFATANAEATTVATGSVDANGTGSDIVTAVTISDKTVAKAASSATTVATGGLSETSATSNVGSEIVSAVTITAKTVATAAADAITVATGALAETSATENVGGEIVSAVSISDKTVAKVASSATTVATGSVDANGTGATVATSLPTGGTAAAQTFTGTQATITVS